MDVAAGEEGAFASFLWGGFECSTHRRPDGRRLDLLARTGHDRLAEADYMALRRHGIATVRDGVRWHLVEREAGRYDWSSLDPLIAAAARTGTQVVWDLCHYGWPDHIDIWSDAFVERFAQFAEAAARRIHAGLGGAFVFCPVNEISFWAWAGGDEAYFNPCARGRGGELKRQLARAAIAAVRAVRRSVPHARVITVEPLIHVAANGRGARPAREAEGYRLAQFEAVDMLTGRLQPELGGTDDIVDIVGLNFYPHNQWYLRGSTIPLGHHAYRRLADLLEEVAQRYHRPLALAETGAEGAARAAWLHYVAQEVARAQARGVPIEGVCLYPVVDYPGWDNGRICEVGLLSMPDTQGERAVCEDLAAEIARLRGGLLPSRHMTAPPLALAEAAQP